MVEQVALITGSSGALGQATATALSRAGWTVVMVARDQSRGQAACAKVKQASSGSAVHLLLADLSSPDSIRRLAAQLLEQFPRLDALIHAAAVYRSTRVLTSDQFELMFATNHLGTFLLTHLLLDRLKASAPSRVLVVSAPSTTHLDFDDLQSEKHFNGFAAFGATKMANLIFAFGLAKRLDGSGVTVNVFHPGIVKSNLMGDAPMFVRWMSNLIGSTPDRPAADLAYLASASELANVTARFFKGRAIIQPDKYALDENVQGRLWNASLRLLGMQA